MPAEVMAEMRHRADRDVQDGGDGPDHQQRGGGAGREVLAEDVAEAGGLDGRGERAADAGQDQDLSAFLEAGGDGLLDALAAPMAYAADEAGADQADQQGDHRLGEELTTGLWMSAASQDRAGWR